MALTIASDSRKQIRNTIGPAHAPWLSINAVSGAAASLNSSSMGGRNMTRAAGFATRQPMWKPALTSFEPHACHHRQARCPAQSFEKGDDAAAGRHSPAIR
jgi:hypothetical protein